VIKPVRREIEEADIVRCLCALRDASEDLEAELERYYKGTEGYPGEARRKERDMAVVVEARRVIDLFFTKYLLPSDSQPT